MNSRFLFPYKFKIAGLILLIPGLILGVMSFFFNCESSLLDWKVFAIADASFLRGDVYFQMVENNVTNELAGILLIVSLVFIAFSREKQEDEYISKIRLESLLWATYINYGILVLSLIFLYNFAFFWVMIFNMFTLLIIFIVRYYIMLNKMKREMTHEE
ncbi:MAG: hypothetical protein U9Q98_02590 [Bacteroidota bacterium]|nr:hypothetical protein [Bacteroidota bacterium]